jgi:hypothetical protein
MFDPKQDRHGWSLGLEESRQVQLGSAEQSRQTLIRALGVNAWTDSFGRNASTDLLMPKGLGDEVALKAVATLATQSPTGWPPSSTFRTTKTTLRQQKRRKSAILPFMNVPPVVDVYSAQQLQSDSTR